MCCGWCGSVTQSLGKEHMPLHLGHLAKQGGDATLQTYTSRATCVFCPAVEPHFVWVTSSLPLPHHPQTRDYWFLHLFVSLVWPTRSHTWHSPHKCLRVWQGCECVGLAGMGLLLLLVGPLCYPMSALSNTVKFQCICSWSSTKRVGYICQAVNIFSIRTYIREKDAWKSRWGMKVKMLYKQRMIISLYLHNT